MNYPRNKSVRFERSSTFLSVNGNLKNVYGKMKTLENWRKTVLFVCVVALAFDPLFFFIPVIDSQRFCFTLDKKVGAVVCVLRTFIDTLYVIHIIFHVITQLIAPRSQVSLRGEIVVHSTAIRKRLFYSAQWRSWAACFIQAAWRRHCKRKLSKILSAQVENLPTPQLSLGEQLSMCRDLCPKLCKIDGKIPQIFPALHMFYLRSLKKQPIRVL